VSSSNASQFVLLPIYGRSNNRHARHARCAHPRFLVVLASASSVSSRLLAAMIFMMDSALFLSKVCSPVSASRRSSCISSVLRMAESVRMFS